MALLSAVIIMATAGLRQPAAVLQTGRCHIELSRMKNPSVPCGLSSKFCDHLYKPGRNRRTLYVVSSKLAAKVALHVVEFKETR